ncbi:MAG: dockerin type I repeat-containing protein [candidate division Zixibacteria bacterium]|nr:dockerin type I repeat-containing protein [candidate division Zixibacteria bacterium]
MDSYVYALVLYDSKLIVAGWFDTAGGVAANGIVSWDGSCWSALGSGVNSYRYTLTVYESKLTVGGWFSIAGEKVAGYVAQWTKRDFICGDANGDGVIELGDVVYLINYVFRNGDPPDPIEAGDCNCNGIVDIGDVVYLINYLYRGGDPPSC